MQSSFPFSCQLVWWLILSLALSLRTIASPLVFSMQPAYSVRIEPFFADECLPIAHPLQVVLENRSASPARWELWVKINFPDYRGRDSTLQMNFPLTCPAYREATYPLLLPIGAEQYEGVYLSFDLRGPGVIDSRQSLSLRFKDRDLFRHTLLSQSLAPEVIRRHGKMHEDPLFLEPNRFYTDWRSYLGMVRIQMLTTDWLTMPSEAREALLTWTEAGGELIFCHSINNPSPPSTAVHPNDFAFLSPAGAFPEGSMVYPHGLGQIVWQPSAAMMPTLTLPGPSLFTPPPRNRLPILPDFQEFGDDLPQVQDVVRERVPAGLLLFLVILFALLVAPFNLWWLARPPHRLRILWTTPAIALSFSLLLLGIFYLQHGTGGRGLQLEVIWKQPGSSQLLRVVRQHSETDLLTNRTFTLPEDAWITTQDFSIDANFSQLPSTGHRFWQGQRLDGNWFQSRSRQSQTIVWRETNRQELSVRTRRDAHPTIEWEARSTWPENCRTLLFRDAEGQNWIARHLAPGQRVILQKASAEDLHDFRNRLEQCGPLSDLLQRQWENGRFLAELTPTHGSALPTLPGLRWTVQVRYFIGLPQP